VNFDWPLGLAVEALVARSFDIRPYSNQEQSDPDNRGVSSPRVLCFVEENMDEIWNTPVHAQPDYSIGFTRPPAPIPRSLELRKGIR